jgi:hypothetical protein
LTIRSPFNLNHDGVSRHTNRRRHRISGRRTWRARIERCLAQNGTTVILEKGGVLPLHSCRHVACNCRTETVFGRGLVVFACGHGDFFWLALFAGSDEHPLARRNHVVGGVCFLIGLAQLFLAA